MKYKTTLYLLPLLVLGGCGTVNWQPIVQEPEDERDEGLRQASSNAAKMVAREDYEQIRRQVWREIDICMARRGYSRSD